RHGGGFCGRIDQIEGQGAPSLKAVAQRRKHYPSIGYCLMHRGSSTHGPVSVALERTRRACSTRSWVVAARPANGGFSAMDEFAGSQPRLSDPMGADLAV